MRDYIITIEELAAYDITLADVRQLDPAPVERTGRDGWPCWLREELAPLLDDPDGRPER
jgi:hypothetical protein